MKRVHLFVSGQVQGVFYRAECARQARALGLAGFVRNLPDGRVEVALEGEAEAVARVLAWCRQGPSHAAVTDVDVTDEPPRGETGFRLG